MRQISIFLLTMIMITATGCASQQVASKPSPTPSSLPIPSPQVNMTALPLNEAWGANHIAHFPDTFGNLTFYPGGSSFQYTISEDDYLCGSINSPTESPQNVNSVALFNLHDGKITTLQTLPTGYYLVSCTATGSWVVWTQSSQDNKNWQMQALNRQSHETRLLDTSNPQSSQAPYPSSDHGYVAWTGSTEDHTGVSAIVYDVASGKKTFLGQGTSFPLISWPWISWGDAAQRKIVFSNMVTHLQESLPLSTITSASFNAGSYVVSNIDYSAIMLYPTVNGAMPTSSYVVGKANKNTNEFVEFPTLNDRLVVWISNNNFTVFDRKLQRPVRISDDTTSFIWPFISSHYLIWREPDPSDKNKFILNVLDTNTLP